MRYSIITVNFNDREGLEKTLNSVQSQSFKSYEHIIIDGGSTDGSKDLIERNSGQLSYWVSEPDNGIYDGMNKGINAASGEYCLFLNSGDTFYSEDVLKNVSDMLDADIVCGDAEVVGSNPHHWTAPDEINLDFWLKRFSICHQSVFIKTAVLKEKPYDTSLRIAADYCSLFYETIVNRRSYKHIHETICYYGCDGVSSNHKKSDEEKKSVIDRFRYLGYIEKDELQELAKQLKPGTRRYRVAVSILKMLQQ